jgi:isopropylmalate/homocitrate/citramalate synthase
LTKNPWIGPMWVSSFHNFNPEVLEKFSLPEKVQIYDVTLRDGEQMPGLIFTKEDKVKIAKAMDEVGIQRIEAGMPAVSPGDFAAIKEIANLGLSSNVMAFLRARKDDVDLALKCDVWGALIEVPSSDTVIEKGFLWTKEKILNAALDATTYAKEHGLHVTFFPYDTTRADPEFLKSLVTTIVEQAHVDSLAVIDTFGCASPYGFAHLVKMVKSWVKTPIEVHCHNELGLAVANSLAAVTAGAEVVHTTVNGIGERSGGAATEEVIVALKLLYGIDSGFNYEKLNKLSKIVQEASGVKVLPNKPVVGETAFGYEAGIPVMFCKRLKAINFLQGGLGYLPEFVGNEFRVVLGKKSGKHSVEWKLEQMGLEATDEQIGAILSEVKELSIQNKRAITDEEFGMIVQKVLNTSV